MQSLHVPSYIARVNGNKVDQLFCYEEMDDETYERLCLILEEKTAGDKPELSPHAAARIQSTVTRIREEWVRSRALRALQDLE